MKAAQPSESVKDKRLCRAFGVLDGLRRLRSCKRNRVFPQPACSQETSRRDRLPEKDAKASA